jgi:hypothetical protein
MPATSRIQSSKSLIPGPIDLGLKRSPLIQPVWASIALAIGAALVALDHFFGFSSGWMRYIAAEQRIRQLLEAFQLDWEMQKANWHEATPSPEQIQGMLARAKEFTMEVTTAVRDETSDWIREFQGAIKQLEKPPRSQRL